jgi:hypothetical protein
VVSSVILSAPSVIGGSTSFATVTLSSTTECLLPSRYKSAFNKSYKIFYFIIDTTITSIIESPCTTKRSR